MCRAPALRVNDVESPVVLMQTPWSVIAGVPARSRAAIYLRGRIQLFTAQLFSPRANVYSRVILLGIVILVCGELGQHAFLRKRGWRDDASEELAESKKEAGFGDRDDIQTWIDLHDAEEGRTRERFSRAKS